MYMWAQRMKIFILLKAMDNSLYPWTNGHSGGVQKRTFRDESVVVITWAGCSESVWVGAMWPVTFRHKPVTTKIKGRLWLLACNCCPSDLSSCKARITDQFLERWPRAQSLEVDWGWLQLAAHVVSFTRLDSHDLRWEVQYGFLWK